MIPINDNNSNCNGQIHNTISVVFPNEWLFFSTCSCLRNVASLEDGEGPDSNGPIDASRPGDPDVALAEGDSDGALAEGDSDGDSDGALAEGDLSLILGLGTVI